LTKHLDVNVVADFDGLGLDRLQRSSQEHEAQYEHTDTEVNNFFHSLTILVLMGSQPKEAGNRTISGNQKQAEYSTPADCVRHCPLLTDTEKPRPNGVAQTENRRGTFGKTVTYLMEKRARRGTFLAHLLLRQIICPADFCGV
jgi:hypothetical protein